MGVDAASAALTFDRYRLRTARQLRRRSQSELARDANVTAAAVSQYESGHARPSPATLSRLADALSVPPGYLARKPGEPGRPPEPFFRSLRSTSSTDRYRAASLAGLVHELATALDQHVALPEPDLPGPRAVADDDDIEQAAADTRAHFDLPANGPVDNVVRQLERHGVVVARLEVQAAKLDAFSVPYGRRPVVVLGADKNARDRSRFDAAHELGHLVMHETEDEAIGSRVVENEAHRFASAFLMPADDIRPDLPARADWPVLLRLKQEWHVSIAALLRRAKDLGCMNDAAYLQAQKAISARGWRRVEPGALGAPEEPALLKRALEVAAVNGMTLEALAEQHSLPLHDLKQIVKVADSRPQVIV